MTNATKPKDEERVAIAEQFGYNVLVGKRGEHSIDSPLPHFHRIGAAHARPAATVIMLPSVHAARFAIPCTECYPEKL